MTVWGLGVVLRLGFGAMDTGFAKPRPGRAGRDGQNAGSRLPKRRTKRLTFTEGRLRLHSSECTTRPESQAFRAVVRRADDFCLDFSLPFHQGKGRMVVLGLRGRPQ